MKACWTDSLFSQWHTVDGFLFLSRQVHSRPSRQTCHERGLESMCLYVQSCLVSTWMKWDVPSGLSSYGSCWYARKEPKDDPPCNQASVINCGSICHTSSGTSSRRLIWRYVKESSVCSRPNVSMAWKLAYDRRRLDSRHDWRRFQTTVDKLRLINARSIRQLECDTDVEKYRWSMSVSHGIGIPLSCDVISC